MSYGEFCPKCRKYFGEEFWHCKCHIVSPAAEKSVEEVAQRQHSAPGPVVEGEKSPIGNAEVEVLSCGNCSELEKELAEAKGALDLKEDEYVQQIGTWKLINRLEQREAELMGESDALRARVAELEKGWATVEEANLAAAMSKQAIINLTARAEAAEKSIDDQRALCIQRAATLTRERNEARATVCALRGALEKIAAMPPDAWGNPMVGAQMARAALSQGSETSGGEGGYAAPLFLLLLAAGIVFQLAIFAVAR